MNQPHFAPGYVISVLLAIGLAAACSADTGTLTLDDDGFAEVFSTGDGDIDATRGMTPGSGTAGTAATGSDRTTLVGEIGFFSAPQDIFCPHFDTKPDLDDVHAQAAVGSVIAHPDISGIDVFAVAGAYGTQDGTFIESFSVMELAFPGNWTSTTGDGYSWDAATDASAARMKAALERGGDVWIAEAGQSDFSHDAIQKVIVAMPGVDTRRFHIVQHSDWNEEVTTQSKLDWLRANVDYIHIEDGNFPNSTPDFKTFPEEIAATEIALWDQVQGHPTLGPLWTEAKRIADEYNPVSAYNNTAIEAGGFDFSDGAETTHIFGYQNDINDHADFFSIFVP